jgi:ketosteroid isomerase-like protein
MRRIPMLFNALFLVFAVVACQPAAPATPEFTDADVAAIRAQTDAYVQAALARDFAAWGGTLSEDVIVLPPNMEPLTGREAAVAWISTFPPLTTFTVNVEEVTGSGNLAFARGTFAFAAMLPDSSSLNESGSFLQIHERQADGSWPYTRLIWHSNLPVPAPTTTNQ